MKNLVLNEFNKIKHTTMIKVVFGLFLIMALLEGIYPLEGKDVFDYAFGAHFLFLRNNGTLVLFWFSPIAVSMITQEFSQGTAHNILSCGISRKKYYMVKAFSLMVTAAIIYLVTIAVYTLTMSILYGFNPRSHTYPNYVLVIFVYHIYMLIVIFAEMALFMCIGYLFNRPAIAYWVCLGTVNIERFLFPLNDYGMGLSLQTLITMENYIRTRTVLTIDFMILLVTIFLELSLCLALACFIFQKKDIN